MKTSHEMVQSVLKKQKKILRRRKAVLTALSAAAGVCAIAGAVILSPTLFPRQGVNLVDSQSPADSAFETKKPLELLNYSANETEEYSVISFYEWETISDFSLFREYFFGTWKMTDGMEFQKGIGKESFIIDDSEKCLNFARKANLRAHDNYYKVSENVLAFTMNSNAEGYLFWLDTNQPDTLYCIPYYPSHVSFKPFVSISGNAEPAVYKKTSAPINEPQNGFLSVYRLYELSREYGIDFDMLVNIEYDDKSGEMLYHDDWYQFYSIYLVSEAPEKLVLNTLLGNAMAAAKEVEVNITFEKIGGEWERKVDIVNTAPASEEITEPKKPEGTDNSPSEAEKALEWKSNAEFYFSQDGLSFQIAANKAAVAFLRGDKEELSKYLADPSYDAGLSGSGTNLYDKLEYMVLKLPDPSNPAAENLGLRYAVYQFALKGHDMLSYLDMGLIKIESGWKVVEIGLQG